MTHLNEAVGLMYWDLRTGAPKKGVSQRSEVIGTLSADVFSMSTSEQMKSYIDELSQEQVYSSLSDVTKRHLRKSKKNMKEIRKFLLKNSKST